PFRPPCSTLDLSRKAGDRGRIGRFHLDPASEIAQFPEEAVLELAQHDLARFIPQEPLDGSRGEVERRHRATRTGADGDRMQPQSAAADQPGSGECALSVLGLVAVTDEHEGAPFPVSTSAEEGDPLPDRRTDGGAAL